MIAPNRISIISIKKKPSSILWLFCIRTYYYILFRTQQLHSASQISLIRPAEIPFLRCTHTAIWFIVRNVIFFSLPYIRNHAQRVAFELIKSATKMQATCSAQHVAVQINIFN